MVKAKKHLLVVVSSDRGLCGGLNTHVIKAVKKKIIELKSSNKNEVKILCIGRKGYEQLNVQYKENIIEMLENITKKRKIPFSDASSLASKIIELFENDKFDVCTIYYNKFISAISQKVTKQQLIPLDLSLLEAKPQKLVYEYEPNEDHILDHLLPENIAVQLYHSFLENAASEHGARMTAMDNATRNAGDMIKKLTLVYNRTRQGAITRELIEIISGAQAVY